MGHVNSTVGMWELGENRSAAGSLDLQGRMDAGVNERTNDKDPPVSNTTSKQAGQITELGFLRHCRYRCHT